MIKELVAEPDQSIRERIEFRADNYYWKDIPVNYKCNRVWPIGFSKIAKQRYLNVTVNGIQYRAHRFVHWLHTGEWPEMVDHIDGDTRNNHYSNLRSSNRSNNSVNRTGRKKTNNIIRNNLKDGSITYAPQIKYAGKTRLIGTYQDHESAYLAAELMRELLYPGINREGIKIDYTLLKAFLKQRIKEIGGLENV